MIRAVLSQYLVATGTLMLLLGDYKMLDFFSFILYLSSWSGVWSSKTQDLMLPILFLKINWGTNFGTLKKTMLTLFDVITYFILFNGGNKTKFLGHDFQWAIFEMN